MYGTIPVVVLFLHSVKHNITRVVHFLNFPLIYVFFPSIGHILDMAENNSILFLKQARVEAEQT